jgi:hypothetical protein
MYDIVANNPEVIALCKQRKITPLIIGKDVELVDTETKTSKALLTIAITGKREVIESNIDAATDIETTGKKDFMHHRNSGLDQVTATILTQRANPYILNLRAFLNADNQEQLLGRIQQNVKIAKKFGIPVVFATFAENIDELPTQHDQEAFWRALGVHAKLVKNSQQQFIQLVERSKTRASDGYVAEGIHRDCQYESI